MHLWFCFAERTRAGSRSRRQSAAWRRIHFLKVRLRRFAVVCKSDVRSSLLVYRMGKKKIEDIAIANDVRERLTKISPAKRKRAPDLEDHGLENAHVVLDAMSKLSQKALISITFLTLSLI
jgi:hypothetical protein